MVMAAERIPINPEILLTEVGAAKQLKLSVRTLQAWRSRKEGPPFVRVGRAIRYRECELLAWLRANTVQPIKGWQR
jgi:predicted DNA-binding transcriptional regulator AlpA